MKNKRIKAQPLADRAAFERIVDAIAELTLHLEELKVQRAAAIQAAQAVNAEAIAATEQSIQAMATRAEKFAEEHRGELLQGKAKSNETPLARYGFRTGMPALKTLAKWTWTKVLEAMDEGRPDWVRNVPTVDKATVISDFTSGRTDEQALASYGVRVVQEETFFIEPKVDEAATVKGAA